MPFMIVEGDITRMETDVIVNAANTQLEPGGGVCGAIYQAAGYDALRNATKSLGPIQTGEAVITEGFRLPAKYIVHTAGPVYGDGKQGEPEQLASAYRNALQLAHKHGAKSIAFPLLSAGIYGYPKKEALNVCIRTVGEFLKTHDMDVYLTLFNKEEFVRDPALRKTVEQYMEDRG